jgi:hypothetical protein
MKQEWSTFGKLRVLLQETGLLPTQFIALCGAYGIEISNATLSRAIKAGRFNNHETDEMLRPLILKLEDLVERAKPFPIALDDADHIKLLLDIIGRGADLKVGAPISINSNE